MTTKIMPEDPGRSLTGRQIGSYQILSLLGAGGMGEVYRARDVKLGRDVAIKILPKIFTTDPERLARFEREARMLAALNHPHIGAIYGLEEGDGVRALVLELVEGDTLAQRLKAGPLPVSDALTIARQIADALDAAHEKGIVHRDLKPANIILQGAPGPTPARWKTAASSVDSPPPRVSDDINVKVLDFGLAKTVASDAASAQDLSQSPTVTVGGTREGVILGTVPYMSPEQARGKPVDKRTDIWAFGCVLYETLTAQPTFAGETISDTIAAILEREPDWQALPAATPPGVRRLLQRCLDKDAKRRLHDIADARVEIDDALDAGRASGPSNRSARRAGAWLAAAAAALLIVTALVMAGMWLRPDRRPPGRDQWVQLTKLPDSVSQPALSPDGRMLTFVRGPGTFYSPGQIYVKILPDGEPKQLTHDALWKMSPVFAPDGSRIAYTTVDDAQFKWDTWVVPVLGGEPRLWLPNASGLTWMERRLLFSEIKKNIHMAIVAAEESRTGAQDVYVPARENGMAHRSSPSADGKWALVAEMDLGWLPCRLVPTDGKSPGHQVGPPRAACMSGAWSPDGKWMYLSSSAGGSFHIWRQRFPDGQPEQITSGPTEEEGIAMAVDGRSFITAVGLRERSVMVRDSRGERQISLEGYAFQPRFTPNGKQVYYLILKGNSATTDPIELWRAELEPERNEPLLPGFSLASGRAFDFSPDGRQMVVATRDRDDKRRLWLVPLDRQSPPRQIPNVVYEGGITSVFWRADEVFFYASEGDSGFAYRVREDGTALRKAIAQPISSLLGVSPDGQWLVAWDGAAVAHRTDGGTPVRIFGLDARFYWSPDRRSLFVQLATTASGGIVTGAGNTYVVPLPPGRVWPQIPAGGFRSAEEIAKLPGVLVIESADATPGPTPDTYAFSRETTQRNLYRIPIP